jgi:hypothetical protein
MVGRPPVLASAQEDAIMKEPLACRSTIRYGVAPCYLLARFDCKVFVKSKKLCCWH